MLGLFAGLGDGWGQRSLPIRPNEKELGTQILQVGQNCRDYAHESHLSYNRKESETELSIKHVMLHGEVGILPLHGA